MKILNLKATSKNVIPAKARFRVATTGIQNFLKSLDSCFRRGDEFGIIRGSLKTKVIGPVLLLIPMACMHLGDGHHSGGQHSIAPQPSDQYQSQGYLVEDVPGIDRMPVLQDAPNRG